MTDKATRTEKDLLRVMLTADQIAGRVAELGRSISEDYAGRELLLISVLKGSVMFMGDLMKQITVPALIDFMAVSSYGSSTISSGVVKINKDVDVELEGKHLLIVEDILDSGKTLNYLKQLLSDRKPASLKIVTLLDKPSRRQVDLVADYTGFSIEDEFVVGYGLDYDGYYRNIPYIGVMKPEVYRAE